MLQYDCGTGEQTGWLLAQDAFDSQHMGKFESVFCQGNGYLGVRCAFEEAYPHQTRNAFIAGTFNHFEAQEVTELPNIPDAIAMDITLDGEALDLTRGKCRGFLRTLNLKNGEVIREFEWQSERGMHYRIKFSRFVSMADLHLVCQRVEITPLDESCQANILSGLDARMTNSGAQHFAMEDMRIHHEQILQLRCHTVNTNVAFNICTQHHVEGFSSMVKVPQTARRQIKQHFSGSISRAETAVFEKRTLYFTDRDADGSYEKALKRANDYETATYGELLKENAEAWQNKVFRENHMALISENEFDMVALRFALYHMAVMTPAHDPRMNIGAKGLSGEGYKGHTFWDTEVFLLPKFYLTQPEIARSLLKYRYLCLDGARRKARENGHQGAMFPWESAWVDDGEVTPLYGDVDVVTGELMKIWTGLIEIHISGDISFAIRQYHQATGDDEFMRDYGYEMLFEIANFWTSRLEWSETLKRYEITDVIGPDEYKEHIDNNAYTNYLAHFSLVTACEYAKEAARLRPELKAFIHEKEWVEKAALLYLPHANAQGIIPQDDTYLSLPQIDLTRYKSSASVGDIYKDFNNEQISQMQISKQADLMVLFLLCDTLFEQSLKKLNFHYYEPRCLHDSSLSLSTYSILAGDVGEKALSYSLFERACRIDLGQNMLSSDAGIHAAAMGGIWQCAVLGFGGVRLREGRLDILPNLPEVWQMFAFDITYRGARIRITLTHEDILLEKEADSMAVAVTVCKKSYLLRDKIKVLYEA
jgi:Trehalose and maltose hydrolases (possible phosphorylases)